MPRTRLTPAQRAEGARLATRLREARLGQGRDQAELARRTGVSVDAIRALEAKRTRTPSFVLVARLARELSVELDALAEVTLAPNDGQDREGRCGHRNKP